MPLPPTITITRLTQPDTGAVIAVRCPVCRTIEIAHNYLAVKPDDGDLWFMDMACDKDFDMNRRVAPRCRSVSCQPDDVSKVWTQ